MSAFSKPLTLLLGLLVVVVQGLEYKGIRLIPYGWLKRRFTSVDVQGLVKRNPAFKLAFGATFALCGFASLES